MRRLCTLIGIVLFVSGCTNNGKKRWYDDAIDDANGKNMEMRSEKGKSPHIFKDFEPSEPKQKPRKHIFDEFNEPPVPKKSKGDIE